MAGPQNESETTEDRLDIRAADVIAALAGRNPSAPQERVASTGQLMALIGEAVQRSKPNWSARGTSLSPPKISALVARILSEHGGSSVTEPVGSGPSPDAGQSDAPTPPALVSRGSSEALQGMGLGERITLAEGCRRLADYATPLALEDWAGPLAGPTDLRERLGIARSTLQDWRRDGAVIGLLKGTRKHVFPLAQFVDGRPVRGLGEVVSIVGDPRSAWLWLVEPDRRGGSHLSDLRRGRTDEVLEAAREDFA